jgi:hypothetical protein
MLAVSENDFGNDETNYLAMLGGSSIAIANGVTEDLTAWVALYPAFIFGGTLYGEIGTVAGLLTPYSHGFGMSVSPRMHIGVGFAASIFDGGGRQEVETILLPQVDMNVYYESRSTRPYIGASMFLPFLGRNNKLNFETDPSLQFGFTLKSRSTEMTFELKTNLQTIDDDGDFRRKLYGLSFSVAGI